MKNVGYTSMTRAHDPRLDQNADKWLKRFVNCLDVVERSDYVQRPVVIPTTFSPL